MPDYRVLATPQWRPVGATRVALFDPSRGQWVALRAWARPVLEGVASGASIAEMSLALAARASGGADEAKRRRKAERRVRRLLFGLSSVGLLELAAEAPPALFDGRYALVRELGRGGVGVAYLCADPTGREVVVKRAWDFLQPYAVTDAALRREADTLYALDHPGIVRLVATFERDGRAHLVREYTRGAPLAARAPIADQAERRTFARQAADILAHLHERGFLLLDLRPANFLVDEATGALRLVDVGQARAFAGSPLALGGKVGSPGFTAPEVDRDARADARTDVWGLGRLLFFLGTGARPSKRADAASLASRAVAADRALVEHLGADEPERRPASARAAAALLSSEE